MAFTWKLLTTYYITGMILQVTYRPQKRTGLSRKTPRKNKAGYSWGGGSGGGLG